MPGQRQFNVGINGTQVLTNFDIVAAAGGKDKAVVEAFTATADGNGQITVNFSQGAADYPLVNGIEVLSGSTVVQAINCGQLAGGTITDQPQHLHQPGHARKLPGGTLAIYSSVAINGSNRLSSNTAGTITISGNLLGNVQNPALYTPQGR